MVQPGLAAGRCVAVTGLRPLAQLCSPSCCPVPSSEVINAFSPPPVSPPSIPLCFVSPSLNSHVPR